jgi:hypothetical protein
MVTQQRHANNPKTRLTNFLTITSPQIVYPMEHHVDNRIAKMVSNTTVVKRVLLGSPTRKSIISVTLCAWTFSNPLFLFQERQHPNFNKVHSSLNTNAMIRMVVNASQCVELRMLAVLLYWFCRRRVCTGNPCGDGQTMLSSSHFKYESPILLKCIFTNHDVS